MCKNSSEKHNRGNENREKGKRTNHRVVESAAGEAAGNKFLVGNTGGIIRFGKLDDDMVKPVVGVVVFGTDCSELAPQRIEFLDALLEAAHGLGAPAQILA